MESLIFHIEADKADSNLLESIKAYFGTQKIEISIKPIKTLTQIIDENRKSKISYVFKGEEFDEMASKILNEEQVDFEAYKKTKS